jgi:ABC-type sugar transport system ATPase subunit
MADANDSRPLLEARGISKAFGHVQALKDVDFELRAGEVLALLGDNGAGKSTLIKIISGLYAADEGELLLDGEPLSLAGPKDAVKAGIATVYQDLALVDSRDVAANLFLGSEFTRGPFVDRKRCRVEAEKLLKRIGVDLPSVRVPVSLLSGGQRQAVAVARALVHGAKLVIMDEPTAALGVAQTEQVMKLVRDLRADGKAVILISHNLRDVWDVTDRLMVLHLGRLAGTRLRNETSLEEIVRLIVYGADEPSAAVPQPVVA